MSPGPVQETGQHLEAAPGWRGAWHVGQPQQCLCGGHEWFAPAGQASRTGLQNSGQLHCDCLFANVQTQALAKQPTGARFTQIQRANPPLPLMSSSTLNGIEPLSAYPRTVEIYYRMWMPNLPFPSKSLI